MTIGHIDNEEIIIIIIIIIIIMGMISRPARSASAYTEHRHSKSFTL